jgi:hypothetical protein
MITRLNDNVCTGVHLLNFAKSSSQGFKHRPVRMACDAYKTAGYQGIQDFVGLVTDYYDHSVADRLHVIEGSCNQWFTVTGWTPGQNLLQMPHPSTSTCCQQDSNA